MLFQHGFVRLELATSICAPTTVVDDNAFTCLLLHAESTISPWSLTESNLTHSDVVDVVRQRDKR